MGHYMRSSKIYKNRRIVLDLLLYFVVARAYPTVFDLYYSIALWFLVSEIDF